jgi:hypothetical protein
LKDGTKIKEDKNGKKTKSQPDKSETNINIDNYMENEIKEELLEEN